MLLSYPSDIALESRSSQPVGPTPPVQRQARSSRAAEFAICDEPIEAGFRADKAKGWRWEDCQVADLGHLDRLLVAMAWATLLVLCLGLHDARASPRAVAAAPPTRRPPTPQPARDSLFSLGLRLARRWLARSDAPPVRWRLTHLHSDAWTTRWYRAQARRYLSFQPVRS